MKKWSWTRFVFALSVTRGFQSEKGTICEALSNFWLSTALKLIPTWVGRVNCYCNWKRLMAVWFVTHKELTSLHSPVCFWFCPFSFCQGHLFFCKAWSDSRDLYVKKCVLYAGQRFALCFIGLALHSTELKDVAFLFSPIPYCQLRTSVLSSSYIFLSYLRALKIKVCFSLNLWNVRSLKNVVLICMYTYNYCSVTLTRMKTRWSLSSKSSIASFLKTNKLPRFWNLDH